MKLRALTFAGLLALIVPLAAAPSTAQAQISIPINFTSDLGSFVGSFTPTRFVNQNGTLAVVGNLTGTVTNAAGTVLGTISQVLTLPISLIQVQGDCEILHLELGPLDLNLLGLVVHLDRVVLDISAESAPGNLLGNLLCAVAHLLDNPSGSLAGLVNILNQILRLLG
jgi:hypothetical protein